MHSVIAIGDRSSITSGFHRKKNTDHTVSQTLKPQPLSTIQSYTSTVGDSVAGLSNQNKATIIVAITAATVSVKRRRNTHISPPPVELAEEPQPPETGSGDSLKGDVESWREWWERMKKKWWQGRKKESAGSVESSGLSSLQLERLSKLRSQIEATDGEGGDKLSARAEAVGMRLNDAAMIRFFLTSYWEEAFSDGNTVFQSIKNTVAWREQSGIWALVTNQKRREKTLKPLLEGGPLVWVGSGVCEGIAGTGLMPSTHGCPVVVIRPGVIRPGNAAAIPDLLLFSMERAEMVAAGCMVGALVVVDCAECSLQDLKSFALAAVPAFSLFATHYPERLAGVRVVNPSRTVAFVYKCFLAPFMTESARTKLKFLTKKRQNQSSSPTLPPGHVGDGDVDFEGSGERTNALLRAELGDTVTSEMEEQQGALTPAYIFLERHD
eukprot:CAMPEP_0171988206 /NCGR_PEP_ID=MMETSP0993-20121228/275785_1 /TAXON_ID=483369 /ORGANISM="non described non described, Strain CCMP2098" /LENGTH=437 /DNA_ID=CAMNT_0012641173 /DNA_START=124 /DNA_END=1438 /DNA_ORIENTATION=-